jgi:hypothetical protein
VSAARSDIPSNLAIVLPLTVGAAFWAGLVAGQLGHFTLVPVVLAAALAALATALGLRARSAPAGDGLAVRQAGADGHWRAIEGPAVFALAALLYAPGYDATLYGSDAAIYLASGAHLATTGSLAIDDPLLRRLPLDVQVALFRPMGGGLGRSQGGLVYAYSTSTVYSTFSQLPSVWLAIGFAAGGLPGARLVGPLLAAGALAAFYLLVRQLSGTPVALLAVGLLAPMLPQLLFARLPTGECGGQFFLWSGLLAHVRWCTTRERLAAIAAGVSLGLAGLARPEYVAFIPLAGVLLWLLTPGVVGRVSALTVALTAALYGHAAALVLVVVPSHYRLALLEILARNGLVDITFAGAVVTWAAIVAAAMATVAVVAVLTRVHGQSGGWQRRALAVVAVVLWAIAYSRLRSPASGQGIPWLPFYASWPVLVLALLGLPLLAFEWWRQPAGRVALLVGAVAAAHLLYDLHTAAFPVWAGRRLVPAVLPTLAASAATGTWALARAGRPLAIGIAVLAVTSNVWNSRPVLGQPFFTGSGALVAGVAELLPADALAVVDGRLKAALLDVSLWLVHGREAVQVAEPDMSIDRRLTPLVTRLAPMPVYLLRPAALPPPTGVGIVFEPAGEASRTILIPGEDQPRLVRVGAFRARLASR